MSDPIKEAFTKVKEDIANLKENLNLIVIELNNLKQTLIKPTIFPTQLPTDIKKYQTITASDPTHNLTELSNMPLKAPITPNNNLSTGNEGVPTNQPTNQQTNQHTGNEGVRQINTDLNNIQKVSEVLSSLDSIKKEVRFKFKKLTSQEMNIFTSIYELEEQSLIVDYSLLSQKLNLTEISIRDYIRKLISKGIPIIKNKENNKKIIISINPDLKRIASIQTIQMLREL